MTLKSLLKKSWSEIKAYSCVFLRMINIRDWPEPEDIENENELRDDLADRFRAEDIKRWGKHSWKGLKVAFYFLSGASIIVTIILLVA